MPKEPLALITAVATALLFLVNWRAANAAKQNADIAAREFRLSRRPLVTVRWDDPLATDDTVSLYGTVTEVTGVPTTLHSVEYIAALASSSSTPDPMTLKPDKILSGDVATFPIVLELRVPEWTLHMTRSRRVKVAQLVVRATISVADGEAVQDQWLMLGELRYDTKRRRYFGPKMATSCLSAPPDGAARG